MFRILLLRFNRAHRLTFFPEFHADLSRYKEKRVHCTSYKTTTFSSLFCAPFGPGRQKFNIWDLSSACKFFSGSIKVCRSYSRKADFEQIHKLRCVICISSKSAFRRCSHAYARQRTIITSADSNLTKGHIATAHRRFSHICQVAPMFTSI